MHERSTGGETPELAQWENQGHEEITAMHGTSRSETAEAQVRNALAFKECMVGRDVELVLNAELCGRY